MRIGIAADHRGYRLKSEIMFYLRRTGFRVHDYGDVILNNDDDFPDFMFPLAEALSKGELDRGIAICGSGIGACIALNRVRHVRAGLIHDLLSARMGVEDDNMNAMCLGADLIKVDSALDLVQCFLGATYSPVLRFERRLEEIDNFDIQERP